MTRVARSTRRAETVVCANSTIGHNPFQVARGHDAGRKNQASSVKSVVRIVCIEDLNFLLIAKKETIWEK